MQIKKFTAPTLREAIEQMKDEFGGESIVLSTKVLEENNNGATVKLFEITAGVDEGGKTSSVDSVKVNEKPKRKNVTQEIKNLSDKIYKPAKNYTNPYLHNKQKNAGKIDKVESQLDKLFELLEQRDVNESLIKSIVAQLNKYKNILDNKNFDDYIISIISSLIPTAAFEVNKGKGPVIISLVGPTGVGKTTCIAKLAVISKILHNLDIGLISIDTYRLGAMDQLKIFSEISNIDFYVAYEPSDLVRHVKKMRKKDVIFIDTVGRSQNNTKLLHGIKDFLSAVKVDETYLVLSSTGAIKNMVDVARKFQVLNYNGFVFTKLDEAVSFGNILNVANSFKVPVKYLTNGQVIPDDIIAADPDFIARMIYTGRVN